MKTTCLVSLAFLALASAVPASNQKWDSFSNDRRSFDSCALQCNAAKTSKFLYRSGSTYIYDYSVDTETAMAGASEDTARLSIKAHAEIQVIDRCEFALLLKDVRVSHTDAYSGSIRPAEREDEFRRALEGSNLRFSFEDGVITSVCPEKEESTWVLNFKRGLLTAFQSSMENLEKDHKVTEVDVSGECGAEFNMSKSWGWKKEITVVKTKNLLACSRRDGYSSMFQLTPYKVASDVQSLPIMKGSHRCEYVIDSNRILKSTSCEESHIFVPFSASESGGRTKVKQQLTLKSQKNTVDALKGPLKSRLSLLFEHVDSKDDLQNGLESLEQKLKEICEQTQDDIRPETPRLYSELVQIIKALSKSELERAHRLVKEKMICPMNGRALKFFTDALPMAGTPGAVSMMTTLITDKQVDGILAQGWLASLAIIQEPTKSMVEDGLKLLQGPTPSEAILPVSALLNRYCTKVASDCERDYHVGQALNILKSNIPSYCGVSTKNLKDVLKTLRAIGNAGQNSLTSTLDMCLTSSTAPLEVRVAAADAYRRMSCDSDFGKDDALWTTLQDSSLDSELRITSYLAVMRCPNDDTLSKISQLLESEADEHLGSFIYSHLNNLKQTSDPLKQDIARAISLRSFKEFTVSPTKYSSNHEASFLIKKWNLGFTSDASLVMNPKTPYPRSAMLNLTVDLFGSSINLFEVGGRVEGLEILLEKLLGSTGYFNSKPQNLDDDKLNDVKGSIYARVFGNEIFYGHMTGPEGLQGKGKLPNMLDILISLANRQQLAYTHSHQLMDVALIIPTVAGLPLEITVNGSVNLDIKAEGKADLRRVSTSPRSMEIDGEIRPSAALEVTGTMAVNALVTRMGLRMRNTMHSSTGLKGHIEISRGRVLNIEIEPPADKMEIFNAKSQFFIIHNDIEKEQNMIKDNYQEYKACSGERLATILGVELCGEIKYPNASQSKDSPYFPLTGPTSLSIMSYRRDTHTSYKILATRKEDKHQSFAQFTIDTPNSQTNRMISADVSLIYTPQKQIDILLVSPWKKISLNSALVANKDLASFVGSVLLDDKDKYGLTSEVKISSTGSGTTYAPFIELTQRGQTLTLLSGMVNMDLPNKFDANLELKGPGMLPYTLEGGLVNQDAEKRVRLGISSQGKNIYTFNVGSTIDRSGKDGRSVKIEPELTLKSQDQTLISVRGSNDYKPDKLVTGDLTVEMYKMKPSSLSWKVSQSTRGKMSSYDIDLKVKSSLLTGSVDGNFDQLKNGFTSKVQLIYNIPKFGTDVITWNTKLNNRSKNTFKKYQLTSNVDMKKYSDYNAGITVNFDHKKKQTDIGLELKYGSNPKDKKKTVTAKYSLKSDVKNWKNAGVDLQLMALVPEKNVNLNMKLSHAHSVNKLDTNMNLKLNPFMKNEVDVGISLQDKSSKLMNYAGQANFGIMGKKVTVNSDLTQTSARQFEHSLDVVDPNGGKHSANTVYKMLSSNGHEVTSDINLSNYAPLRLQGKTTLDLQNLQLSASVALGEDNYNISAQSKLADSAKKWSLGLAYPNRQIDADVEVKNMKDKVSGSFMVDWDVKRNIRSKISVDGSFRNSESSDSKLLSGTLNVKTPFGNWEDLGADATYTSDSSQYTTKGKVSWGGKQEAVTSSVVVKRPLSLENAEVTFVASTPFRMYREIELSLDHKLDRGLNSALKGKVENNIAELIVKGENRGDRYNRNVYGSVELKTPFSVIRDMGASLEHSDDGRQFKTLATFGHNNKKFGADLQMDHSVSRSGAANNGNLKLSWPEDMLQTTWKFSNQGSKQVAASVESTWSNNKHMLVSLTGSNNMEGRERRITGNVNVQTPWSSSREATARFEMLLAADRLMTTASVHNNREEKLVYNILLERAPQAGGITFMLKSPLYDQKIHGQTKLSWNTYPLTASAWLEWAPWARIDFDGSANVPSVDDIDVNMKLSTPFKPLENIVADLSHKLEGTEYVSQAKIKYEVRKSIIFENRWQYDYTIKSLRTKLTSPCPYLKSLSTGFRLNANSDKFEGSADFEMQPMVKKYDGFVIWNYDLNDFNGKLRVNTPHQQLPYLQLSSWSRMKKESERTSHIDFDSSTYGVYSLDSSYRLQLPYQLDINLKTPHPKFDTFSMAVLHSQSANSLQSRLRVMYLPNREVDSQLKLDWKNKLEGSLEVNTPFVGFEKNKILARHEKTTRGCTSHAEANIGGKNVQGDLIYASTSSVTSGSISIITPVSGYEKVSATFNLKGPLNKMKGDASMNIGSDALTSTFSNNMSPGFLLSTMELYTPYTKDLKLSVQHKGSSNAGELKLDCKISGQYGDLSTEGKLGMTYAGMEKGKLDVSLNTPFKSGQVILENAMTDSSISGKAAINTDIEPIGNVEVTYSKNGPLTNLVGSVSAVRNGETLIDTSVETSMDKDVQARLAINCKWMPILSARLDHRGDLSDFSSKARFSSGDSIMFDNEIIFKAEGDEVNIVDNLKYKYFSEDSIHTVTIRKEGTQSNFRVDFSKKCDGDEITANIVFQSDDQIKGLIQVNNLLKEYDKVSVEVEHTGDLDKFLTSGKLTLGSENTFTGKVDFYRYSLQRIEATAEVTTPWPEYKYNRFEYRHEGGEGRLSCSMNLQYGNGNKFSSDLITQCSASAHSLSFNLKTPFRGYEEILFSGDFDNSKANGRAMLGQGMEFTLSGEHDVTAYPFNIQYEITTPLDILRKVTLNLKGQPLDGSLDLAVLSRNKKIDSSASLRYTSPYSLSLSSQLTSNIRGYSSLQLNLKNEEDASRGKTSHFLVSWDPRQQVVMDARYSTGSSRWSSKEERVFELDLKTPFESLKNFGFDMEYNAETNNIKTALTMDVNEKKLVDLDVSYDTNNKYEYSAIIRKPWPMEYTVNYQANDYVIEGEVYANWNRDDMSSNVRVKSTLKDGLSNNERSASVILTTPYRTAGVEHSASSSSGKYFSSGKVYWDRDDDSKLSYSVDLSSSRRRSDMTYNSNLKLGLPSRTLGVSASVSKNGLVQKSDAAFSWDLGRDDNKRIEVQATLSGQDYTKADISLRLPAQDLQVDTSLIFNQGNIIIDGKTDISYSRESRKTLTLFSRVKNTSPSSGIFDSGSGFNYSMELGMKHPESMFDVRFDSHVARSDELLTSSLGLQYLTTRRQMKNLALFAEIDKIRRQVNLVASGPSSVASVSGKFVSDQPLSLQVFGSLDGQERFRSTLNVDQSLKNLQFDIGQTDDLLSLKAYYPNNSAIVMELSHVTDDSSKKEALVGLRLMNPYLLQSRIQWRPMAMTELENFVTKQISASSQSLQETLQQINLDIQTELSGKYDKITSSVVEDMRPLLRYLGTELESFAKDLDSAKLKLNEMYNQNEFFLQDISLAVGYISQMYTSLMDGLQQVMDLYRTTYINMIQVISDWLDKVQQFSFYDSYNRAVTELVRAMMESLDGAATAVIRYLRETDLKLLERAEAAWSYMGSIYEHPRLGFIRERIEMLKNFDYGYYLQRFNDAVKSSVDPSTYTNLMSSARDATVMIIPESVKDMAERANNEIYQQAQLAYRYWNVEQSLTTHLKMIVELLKDILEDEFQEYLNLLTIRSPVTLYDPKNGLIVINFPLPVEIKRLDELPDLTSYIQTASDMYKKYAPDLNAVYQYSPITWSNNSENQSNSQLVSNNILTSLDEFQPSRQLREPYVYRQ